MCNGSAYTWQLQKHDKTNKFANVYNLCNAVEIITSCFLNTSIHVCVDPLTN